jgi:MYXO-CTERM domain-containing protein
MRRGLWSSLIVCALSAPGALPAAPNLRTAPTASAHVRDVVVEVTADQASLVDVATFAAAGSKILYVNRCEDGETIKAASINDSRTNRSTVPSQDVSFDPYPFGNASWGQVMFEVRDILAPFAIEVVDVDPGSTVSHFEIIACGQSFFGENVLGVAPSACAIIENGIGFAFAEQHGNAPRFLAETIAHEAAHMWTMDHLYDCEDPMTYLTGCGKKYFQDKELRCAAANGRDWVTTNCKCPPLTEPPTTTMNSYATLLAAFGPSGPTPPVVRITAPLDRQVVGAGFAVRAEVTDSNGVASVELYVDDQLVYTLDTTPYVFNAPAGLADGSHRVEIKASDRRGATGSADITVTVGEDCGCAANEVCIDGSCEPFGGGLGATCADNADCNSGLCGSDGAQRICTEVCDGSCPSGFSCEPAGGVRVCWPAEGSHGGLGGCAAGGAGRGPVALVALLGLALARGGRRRRR